MLEFLPLSLTSVSHRLPASSPNSFIPDEIPDFSLSDHGAYDTTTAPAVVHVASSCKIQQADFTAQAALRSPASLLTQFTKWNHSIQFTSRNSYLSSLGNKSRPPPSSSTVARKALGKQKGALDTLTDGSQSDSEPIKVGVVSSQTEQKMDPLGPPISSLTRRPARATQGQPSVQSTFKPSSTARSPFFSRGASIEQSSSLDDLNDEFMDLNIHATLFPTGVANPYSPAAFKSLAQKADQLLSRLQAAYKECKLSLREMTVEKETQAEELESYQMRTRHLQIQLDKMTVKFAEQDQAMIKLVDELTREKQSQFRQEPQTPKRSARPMAGTRADVTHKKAPGNSEILEARRGSDISMLSMITDSGFESDEESLTNLVGVKHQDTPSPSVSVSSASTTNSRDLTRITNLPPPTISYPVATAQPPRPKGPPVRAPGPFPSVSTNPALASTLRNPFDMSCSNCQGIRASEAWNVVSVLQDENRGLKERLGQLESSFDECLDFVTRMIGTGRMTG